MKTICKITMIVLLVINTINAFGQDTTKTSKKIKEYVLSFTNLSPINVSIRYKKQLKPKTFFTIGIVNLTASNNNVMYSSSFSNHMYAFSAGLECGIEFRRSITDNLTFFHGPNLSFTYSTNVSKTDNPTLPPDQRKTTSNSYDGGIPYTLGLMYHLKNHFLISVEINPSILVSYRTMDNGQNPQYNTNTFSPSLSFGNKYGLLSLIYRI